MAQTFPWPLLILLVVGAAIGLGWLAVELLGLPARPISRIWPRALGAPLAPSGLALVAWTLRHIPPRTMAAFVHRSAKSTERAVHKLVTTGPYDLVRNPICLAVFLRVSGIGLSVPFVPMRIAAMLVVPRWSFVVIASEEADLRAALPETYEDLAHRTPRPWPGLQS